MRKQQQQQCLGQKVLENNTNAQSNNTNAKWQHHYEIIAPTREVATPIENNNINAKTQHQHEATTPT